jgi:predicted MFS family arabinose efflux permease
MKYFEGNIFVNFYIFGAAGVIAVIIGGFLYTKLGVRNTYVLSFYLSIVGALGVIMVQMNLMGYK